MIRNLEKKDFLQALKTRTMLVVSRIIKAQNMNSSYMIVIFVFISFISAMSILFKNDPLSSSYDSEIFKVFILSHVSQLAKLDQMMMNIIIITFILFANMIFILNLTKDPISYSTVIAGYLLIFSQILVVPMSYNMVQNISQAFLKKDMDANIIALKIITGILQLIMLVEIGVYSYFDIRPLRKSNLLWNFDNQIGFYYFLVNISRSIVIYFDDVSILTLIISLVVQVYLNQIPSCYLNRKTVIIFECKNKMVILLHLSLIIGQIFRNKQLCYIVFCVTQVACVLLNIFDYFTLHQSSKQIPKCCFENCTQIYSFYIEYKQKNKKSVQDIMKKISAHYLICRSDICIFKDTQQICAIKVTIEDFEQRISKFLKLFRYKIPQSQILYQIWKIQMNKTITLSHKLRDFSLSHKYVAQYVLGVQQQSKKDLITGNNNANLLNDSMNQKFKFYKQLNCAVSQFQKMAQVMCKPLPELNQVINVVIRIHSETSALTQIFTELIKNKQVNYFCIQLYLKFFQTFLDQTKLSSDILDRLKRLKFVEQSNFIQQVPLPCFLVQAYTKNIQKVNAQALKFLRSHRYEVKDKSFGNLITPTLDLKQLYLFQTKNQKDQLIPIFFKIKKNENYSMICRNIKMRQIQISNKNYFQITVHKKNHNCNLIQILIDESQEILASTTQSLTLPFKKGKVQKTIKQIYNEQIKQQLKQISETKIARVELGQRNTMIGLIIQKVCPYPNLRLISITLIKKIDNNNNQKRLSTARLSRLYNSYKKFNFFYRQDKNQNVVLQGSQFISSHQENDLNDTHQMRSINQKVNQIFANILIPNIVNYSTGIKVYRLYKNDLYNIDLQDKAKYDQQFDGLKTSQQIKNFKFRINENLIIFILLIIAIFITGSSILLSIVTSDSLSSIQKQELKLIKIQQFNLDFNRVMSIIRDVTNGIFNLTGRNFNELVMNSYNDLTSQSSFDLFSPTNYIVKYTTQTYRGSLNQLIQVGLAHVYQFLQVMNLSIIEDIHDYAIKQINPKIILQKSIKKQKVHQISQKLMSFSLFCFIFILGGNIIYFLLYLLISQKFKKNMDAFLQPLLIISQHEIRRILEQCEKFNNSILSLYKNYQVDIESIGSKRLQNYKRKRPKRTNFGFSSRLFQILFGGFLILILFSLSLVQFRIANSQLVQMNKLFSQGESVIQIYSGFASLTNYIDHTGTIDYQMVSQISQNLTLIQNSKNKYQFSKELSEIINKVFFQDSCQHLVEAKIISPGWCGNKLFGFTQTNPFGLSLDLYFRRLNYNLVVNITDTFAATGVYSDPFKQLFKYLSNQISREISQKIGHIKSNILVLNILVCIMSFFLIIMFLLTLLYFKIKIKTINNSLVSFSQQNSQDFIQITNQHSLNNKSSARLLGSKQKNRAQFLQKGEDNFVQDLQVDQVKQQQ